MSADELRQASTTLRRASVDAKGISISPELADALASWMYMSGDHAMGRGVSCPSCGDQAQTVARLINGGAE